jgi:hypothetical protein
MVKRKWQPKMVEPFDFRTGNCSAFIEVWFTCSEFKYAKIGCPSFSKNQPF